MNTSVRIWLVVWYLWACIRYRAIPWHYFQLNRRYFNARKGLFSKLDMDRLIPSSWRLDQYYYHPDTLPARYPVFIKPEWGQNANGIILAKNLEEYRVFQSIARSSDLPFIVQEAAPGNQEFEIYFLRSTIPSGAWHFLSITRVTNTCRMRHPINSIHNPCTVYEDITPSISPAGLGTIQGFMSQLAPFPMARVGVKADGLSGLLAGRFHVVEINLFLPMPLVLLSKNVPWKKKEQIIRQTMSHAARLVKDIPRSEVREWIFFKKMTAHYKVTP